MHTTPLDQQLQERLTLIESGAEPTTVADLPLRDLLTAVIVLAVVIAALTWWAY